MNALPMTRTDKLLFALIGFGSLIAISGMFIWLVVSMPLPSFIAEMIAADSTPLPQPELQHGRGHTMTTNQGIHSGSGQTMYLVPTIFSLILINILLWVWFIRTRIMGTKPITERTKPVTSEAMVVQPSAAPS